MAAKRKWHVIATLGLVCLVGYFLYHTVEGERGWVAKMHLQGEVEKAQRTLDALQKEQKDLEHRVHLMRPESMDPDLLDEESRKTLNYSKPNEIIILTPQDKSPALPPSK
jgi:cell division protein FtsB